MDGPCWSVCHLAHPTLLSLPFSLPVRIADDSGGHRGIASRSSIVCYPSWRSPPPPPHTHTHTQPAVFQERATAVMVKTTATRPGLAHKTSQASVAMKTQVCVWGGSVFTALLSDCGPLPLHTASVLFTHLSLLTVGDPECAIHPALTGPKCSA